MKIFKKVYWSVGIICLVVLGLIMVDSRSMINLFAQTKKPDPKGPATPTKPTNTPTITKKSISEVAKFVIPSVVNINTIRKKREHDRGEREGTGTGFIIDKRGYILTNNHVVTDETRKKPCEIIIVVLSNKKEISATIVGRDEKGDLAVILLDEPPDNLKPIVFGDSEKMEVGDWVVAIGNPLGIGTTVTSGIVSAWYEREEGEDITMNTTSFIQTDCVINHGNSGGPLINLQGEVIGVNAWMRSTTGAYMGIGFAIPINRAKAVAEALIKDGHFYRPYIGMRDERDPTTGLEIKDIQEITLRLARRYGYPNFNAFLSELKLKDSNGVFVSRVMANSPAANVGIKEGDVIIELNGKTIEKEGDFKVAMSKCRPDVETEIKIIRGGNIQTLKITPSKDEN